MLPAALKLSASAVGIGTSLSSSFFISLPFYQPALNFSIYLFPAKVFALVQPRLIVREGGGGGAVVMFTVIDFLD